MDNDNVKILRDNEGKRVVIDTKYGEHLIANIHWVSDEDEDVTYELVSSTEPSFQQGSLYALPLKDIISVTPL